MNNNNKNKGDFLKENGLIVGLYSVVGVLVVTAGILTVHSIEPASLDDIEGEQVNNSITESYVDEQIGDSAFTDVPNFSENTSTTETKPETTPNNNGSKNGPITSESLTDDALASGDVYSENAVTANSEGVVTQDAKDVATVSMYTAYNEGDKMQWPVTGEVVLPYSNLLAIYDPTLEQFRTNDVLSIKSDVGQNVQVSAEGQVLEVSANEVLGNYVVVQHGNGWSTTYGQLENVTVKAGDVLSTGFIIGQTAAPTKYSVSLGSHVDFKVTHNETTVNPETVLAKK